MDSTDTQVQRRKRPKGIKTLGGLLLKRFVGEWIEVSMGGQRLFIQVDHIKGNYVSLRFIETVGRNFQVDRINGGTSARIPTAAD